VLYSLLDDAFDVACWIAKQFKLTRRSTISKRAFQTQFKRWQFPSKQHPAHKNAPLVDRIGELWKKNTSQKEMLRILNEEEGFEIKERELMRVRAKYRWLLRVPNGMKSVSAEKSDPVAAQLQSNGDSSVISDQVDQMFSTGDGSRNGEVKDLLAAEPSSSTLTPEVLAKRKERLEKLKAESAERWVTRKRRRRTRGWAGLPADPPGPPRFPSETTIDESKVYLSLDNNLYRDIRDRFQSICQDMGVIKKTLAGPELWQAAKDRLIRECPHLQTVFWGNNTQLESKNLSLDVVCTDVTKRMRTLERRMTIAEAKNALGVNPEESREIRNEFYQILKDDHFTSKLEAGDDHWRDLKAKWIMQNDLLKNMLASEQNPEEYQQKVKAMEVLCRDVMKRLRDDQTKRDPSRKKAQRDSLGYAPAVPQMTSRRQRQVQQSPVQPVQADHGNLQIDPSLLLAANDPSLAMDQHQQNQHYAQTAYEAAHHFDLPQASIPVYFRLATHSQVQQSAKVWLGTMTSGTLEELRSLATMKSPGSAAIRIEGLVKDQAGSDVSFSIDEDDELAAYLEHIQDGKANFVVHLIPGFNGA
jgi:hypothetical protein